MRNLTRCLLSAAAASLLAGGPLPAQDPAAPQTHTVVRGDNLWDLAQKYLGNPFLWPELYRLNRDVVEDPHWIYPGEVLRLSAPGVAPMPGDPEAIEAPIPAPPPAAPRPAPAGPTVFHRPRPVALDPTPGIGRATGIARLVPAPTVRPGQAIAAPFVDREGGPHGFGRILKSGDIAGVAEASDRFRFQAYDRIFIVPPVGYVAPEGEQYLAVRLGPVLDDIQGQVIVPTGIVEVTRAARSDVAAAAKVVRAFAELSAQDRLIPLDTAGLSSTVRPVPVDDGPSTEVVWIFGEPVLPSVQNFVVLGVTSNNGVRRGDEFLIYRKPPEPDQGELRDPEIAIAKVQVVRATPYGVTAVVLGQEQPAIKQGMAARIVARMP